MIIEIGGVYKTQRGHIAWIGGYTKNYPEWVWSTQGNWYRQSDGRYITGKGIYDKNRNLIGFDHYPMPIKTGLDLVEKIKDNWKDY